MKEIFERRSIRKYTDQPVSDGDIEKILRAAMAAPSAGNQQPWEFIVIKDRNLLNDITKVHPHSHMLKEANVAIVVCADPARERYSDFWVQDCAAATENMLLEAQHLGIGSVWLGVYPREDRVKGIREILGIPERIVPFSIVSLGYPAEKKEPSDRYDSSRIHINKW